MEVSGQSYSPVADGGQPTFHWAARPTFHLIRLVAAEPLRALEAGYFGKHNRCEGEG